MHGIYDYLASYQLTSHGQLLSRLFALSDDQMDEFFAGYRRRSILHPGIARAPLGAIDIYPDSWMSRVPLSLVKQLVLYANTIYLHDPLLGMAREWESIDINPGLLVKRPDAGARRQYFRMLTAATIDNVLDLRTLVEAGVVRFLPPGLTQYTRDPNQLYEEDFYGPQGSAADLDGRPLPQLPAALQSYVDQHLHVAPLRPTPNGQGGWELLSPESLELQRMIGLYFDGDPYFVFRGLTRITVLDNGSREMWQQLDLTGTDNADPETFRHWVAGCRRQVAVEKILQLEQDLLVAQQAGARFLTTLPASRDLAQLSFGDVLDDDATLATHLSLELPYFDHITIESLARARRDVAAFEEFRVAYHRGLQEISQERDSRIRQRHAEELARELILAPVARINQEMRALQRNQLTSSAIVMGSFMANLFAHPLPFAGRMLSSAITSGITEALKTYQQDSLENTTRRLPGMFYWKAIHSGS